MSTITQDEWLAAVADATDADLQQELAADADALTVSEFAGLMKCSRVRAERLAKILIAQGKAVKTTKAISVGGVYVRRVPAYRLVK